MRRAVILFPSGFTLGNLFFGIFAIIAASRFEFTTAGVYVMLGGICDALDGRVARATNSGTQFGEELDSLVDAITFGLAPGMIMYFAVLNRDGWDWVFVFLFAACAVLRLARFNIEQAGTAKTYFQGLPSPAAGITLASYYWFSQSWLYSYGAVADLKWHVLLRFIMVALSILMISNVPYPAFPRTGFRSVRAMGASVVVVGAIALLLTRKLEYFFPISLVYVAWGLIRWIFSGLFERRQPTIPYDLSEGEGEEEDAEYYEEDEEVDPSQVHASRPPRRADPAPRGERIRANLVTSEHAEPARPPKRATRPAKSEPGPRDVRADVDVRPAVSEKGSESTPRAEGSRAEGSRAARREKRETSQQREQRSERTPHSGESDASVAREARPARQPVEEFVPTSSAPADALGDEQIIGTILGTEMQDLTDPSSPSRKRKRRRRRGARDRTDAASSSIVGADETTPDLDRSDGPGEEGASHSPYSAAAGSAAAAPSSRRAAAEEQRGGDLSSMVDSARTPYTPPLPMPDDRQERVTPTEPGSDTSR